MIEGSGVPFYCRFMICTVHHVQSTMCVLSLSPQKSFIHGKERRLFLCHKWENVPAARWWRALRGHHADMPRALQSLASQTPVSLAAFPGMAVRGEDRPATQWKAGKGIHRISKNHALCMRPRQISDTWHSQKRSRKTGPSMHVLQTGLSFVTAA